MDVLVENVYQLDLKKKKKKKTALICSIFFISLCKYSLPGQFQTINSYVTAEAIRYEQ